MSSIAIVLVIVLFFMNNDLKKKIEKQDIKISNIINRMNHEFEKEPPMNNQDAMDQVQRRQSPANHEPVNQQEMNQQEMNQQEMNQQEMNPGVLNQEALKQQDLNSESIYQQAINQEPVNQHQPNQQAINQRPVDRPQEANSETFKQAPVRPQSVEKEITVSKPIFPENFFSIESIISKLGILLLLIGVGFTYKLAYDNGYITPPIAIALGYLLGGGVLFVSNRVAKKDRNILSQVLYGGGIAILYIVTYSGYQQYKLFGNFIALVILLAITFLAFMIALSIDSVSMSIIGLLGGLLTPFLVGTDYLGLYGMGVYIVFVSVGSMAIFVFKKWRILQGAAIIGVTFTTLLIIFNSNFSTRESFEMGLLLTIIYLIFWIVDYLLYYIHDYNKMESILSFILLTTLPFLFLAQIHMVLLDLSLTQWGIIYTLMAAKFFGFDFILYKKKGENLISNALMFYLVMFTVIAVGLFTGNDYRYIGVLVVALAYMVAGKRLEHKFLNIMSLVVYGFGYLTSILVLISDMTSATMTIEKNVTPLLIFGLLIVGALVQKGLLRRILGSFSIQGYLTFYLLFLIEQVVAEKMLSTVLVLAFTGFLWGYIWLKGRFDIVATLSTLILSLLPASIFVFVLMANVVESSVDWYLTLAFIIYGASVYAIATITEDYPKLVMFYKPLSLLIAASIILVNIPVATSHFEYGLVLFGVLSFGLKYIEKEDRVMEFLQQSFTIAFVIFTVLYMLYGMVDGMFFSKIIPLGVLVDIVILVLLYFVLVGFKTSDVARFVSHMLIFMGFAFKDFGYGNSGLVTLLWAGYGIIALAYFLNKGKRKLVNIALGMIIFVAAKFVLVDLSTVAALWKIITSMAFGVALLILSYIIQPILKREEQD